jgi:hypothetical protein
MLADTTEMSTRSAADAGPKARLLTLSDLDRRTMAFRKTNDLISQIETDLGGHDSLSTAERQIVQRAALTGALLEDLEAKWLRGEPIDPALYATLGNAQRRLFETVGLKRVPKNIATLGAILSESRRG